MALRLQLPSESCADFHPQARPELDVPIGSVVLVNGPGGSRMSLETVDEENTSSNIKVWPF